MPQQRYFYSDKIADFLQKNEDRILGELSRNNHFSLEETQRDAWLEEIRLLKEILDPYSNRGSIFFEYNIPRMGRRIDIVVLIDGIVFVLEFKVFNGNYLKADIEQTWDYALDLKNFHEESHSRSIIPILIATDANEVLNQMFRSYNDNVYYPLLSNRETLSKYISDGLIFANKCSDDDYLWGISRYSPTPTIIEAASALYNSHSVSEISRNDASAENLTTTCDYITKVIEECKTNNKKGICFVTGVPGAGKTLVGLNIATKQFEKKELAVYLSGNGPLVSVLTEALARDKVKREKKAGRRITKKEAESEVKTFIQIIHHYRDSCLEGTKIVEGKIVADLDYFRSEENKDKSFVPIDHVAIFDEAQRAWTKKQLTNFMTRKKGRPNFQYSEPDYLISCLDRHQNWAVIICLVGGGQEINTGEAGISEWLEAINTTYKDWNVYISDRLYDKEYAADEALNMLSYRSNVFYESSLHLAVSMRSFRAEKLSLFVHYLLDLDVAKAKETYAELTQYPIVITRSIDKAKRWLKEKARGTERYGMMASSSADRIKPLSLNVRYKPDVVHWFLDDNEDVRSSNFLEDVVTEFDIQGLEVDWTCIIWDGDFRYSPDGWKHYSFNGGNKWNNINQKERQSYQTNAYRVLLTRARQGMVVVVPEGDDDDKTRKKEYYDGTYEYLKTIGITEI